MICPAHRNSWVQANRQLDQRREFTEAVLAGASSGVIGLDRNGVVTLPNQAACRLWICLLRHFTGPGWRRRAAFVPFCHRLTGASKTAARGTDSRPAAGAHLTVQAPDG